MAAVLVKLLMALPQKPNKKQLRGGCNWVHSLGPGDGNTQMVACISEDQEVKRSGKKWVEPQLKGPHPMTYFFPKTVSSIKDQMFKTRSLMEDNGHSVLLLSNY